MATMTMDFGAPRVATRPRSTASVRLTPRGRAVVRAAIVLLVACTAFVVLSFGKSAVVATLSRAPQATVATHTVVVQPGQTLWQIAAHEMPGADPREGIGRIRTLNGLSAADTIVAGQELSIPA